MINKCWTLVRASCTYKNCLKCEKLSGYSPTQSTNYQSYWPGEHKTKHTSLRPLLQTPTEPAQIITNCNNSACLAIQKQHSNTCATCRWYSGFRLFKSAVEQQNKVSEESKHLQEHVSMQVYIVLTCIYHLARVYLHLLLLLAAAYCCLLLLLLLRRRRIIAAPVGWLHGSDCRRSSFRLTLHLSLLP